MAAGRLAKRVCVIGAGMAGLAATKVLHEDGFDVTAFEREPGIGGVWIASRTYPDLRANISGEAYAFTDHPFEVNDDYPRDRCHPSNRPALGLKIDNVCRGHGSVRI